MAETIEILKPQEPLKRGDKYIFPLTSSDQIILSGEDSAEGERFTLSNVVKQGIENADTGEAPLVNADLLGGNIKSEDIINIQNQVSELNQHLTHKSNNAENGYDGLINITSYNSQSNYFTSPKDGYVRITCSGASATSKGVINILLNDGSARTLCEFGGNGSVSPSFSVFIPKGTKIYISDGTANFIGIA